MNAVLNDKRGRVLLTVVMLLGLLLLAVRSGRAVSRVVTLQDEMSPGTSAEHQAAPEFFGQAETKDEVLATVGGGTPDPFRTGGERPDIITTETVEALEDTLPILGGLFWDDAQPVVKIYVGASVSPWLHAGERFQEWRVSRITQFNATVVGRGRTLVLE